MIDNLILNLEEFRWPVRVSSSIQAAAGDIWKVITIPGNLNYCHPYCQNNPVYEWPGTGSRDTIYYYSGWVLHRVFVNWIEGSGYDLTIGRENGGKSAVSWRIIRQIHDRCKLSITIYPHILQNIPSLIGWLPYRTHIQPQLTKYLYAVVSGFDWYISTGQPVKEDQFGRHRWFSRKAN